MPAKLEIIRAIRLRQSQGQRSYDYVRKKYIRALSAATGHDVILYASAFTSSRTDVHPSLLTIVPEDIQAFMTCLHGLKSTKLDLILHSPGGSPEAAEQIIRYLRSKYDYIRAIVPQNAMSAATMISCGCDEVMMGKHSAIGPIDPQMIIPTRNGWVSTPAKAIQIEFELAKKEVSDNPNTAPLWVTKIESYPPGILAQCAQVIEYSESFVRDLLAQFMFGSDPNRETKADFVAHWLAEADNHKTHGKPIMRDAARASGLVVSNMENEQTIQEIVLSIFHATMLSFEQTPVAKIVENNLGRGAYYGSQ